MPQIVLMCQQDTCGGRVMQCAGPAPVSLFSPPETGKGGGEGRWSAQTVLPWLWPELTLWLPRYFYDE